jgi:hypothetical protein
LACKPRSVPRRQPVYGLTAFIPRACGWAIISLGRRVTARLKQPTRGSEGTSRPLDPEGPSPLLGLAPGGGCLAAAIAGRAGGLLRHLFTLTPACAGAVCFCGPVRGSPRPGVARHRALWSADFPQPAEPAAIARPTQHRFHHTPPNPSYEVPWTWELCRHRLRFSDAFRAIRRAAARAGARACWAQANGL